MAQSNSRLVQQQADFAQALAQLLQWSALNGQTLTLGEVRRPPVLAKWYARIGVGVANSRHIDSLAADLKLYVDGVYRSDTPSYFQLGAQWEKLDKRARWGGRFPKPDGNHFEFIQP